MTGGDAGESGAHTLLFLDQGADHMAVVTLWDLKLHRPFEQLPIYMFTST